MCDPGDGADPEVRQMCASKHRQAPSTLVAIGPQYDYPRLMRSAQFFGATRIVIPSESAQADEPRETTRSGAYDFFNRHTSD